tara:strand:- start:2344 stop:2922 length:579 start_codon:yes stop_codon:yes gene_type:complete
MLTGEVELQDYNNLPKRKKETKKLKAIEVSLKKLDKLPIQILGPYMSITRDEYEVLENSNHVLVASSNEIKIIQEFEKNNEVKTLRKQKLKLKNLYDNGKEVGLIYGAKSKETLLKKEINIQEEKVNDIGNDIILKVLDTKGSGHKKRSRKKYKKKHKKKSAMLKSEDVLNSMFHANKNHKKKTHKKTHKKN